MTLDWVLQAVVVAVGCLGGGSVIMIAVTKWVSDILAEKIKSDIEQKQKKDIANYEKILADSTAKLNTLLQTSSYITQQQYNLEVEIYKHVWEVLFDLMSCKDRVKDLKVLDPQNENILNENDLRNRRNNNYSMLSDKLSTYRKVVDANAPFYQKESYEIMKQIAVEFQKLNIIFSKYKDEIRLADQEDEELLDQVCSEIEAKTELLVDTVRTYLQSLKCVS